MKAAAHEIRNPFTPPPESPLGTARGPRTAPRPAWLRASTFSSVRFVEETRVVRAERDESDNYLIRPYHFTDGISLFLPINHMALKLLSPGPSRKDWLSFILV